MSVATNIISGPWGKKVSPEKPSDDNNETGPSSESKAAPAAKSGNKELDAWLIAVAENRDREAFVALFNATSSRLKAYAIQCGANAADAEELLQECMLTVWRKAHTFKPQYGSAITWLYTIVRNKRIDFARKGKGEVIQSDDLFPEEVGEELETEVEGDLNAAFVRNLLTTLPDEQRQIVFKVYFEGKSHSEIAGELDLPLGTIKSRLRLAMKKLDNLVAGQSTWLIIILMMNY